MSYLGRQDANSANIIGGSANDILIQTATDQTGFLSPPPNNGYLRWNGFGYDFLDRISLSCYENFGNSFEIFNNHLANPEAHNFQIDNRSGAIALGVYGPNASNGITISYHKDKDKDGSNGWWRGIDIGDSLWGDAIEYAAISISTGVGNLPTKTIGRYYGVSCNGPNIYADVNSIISIPDVFLFRAAFNNDVLKANNVYGYYSDIVYENPLITGNNSYNFYAGGSAPNHFEGETTFGNNVILGAVPTLPMHAVTKAYVDALAFASSGGGTGTGAVDSVNGQTGVVVLTIADISGAAPINNAALTGTPTAPTPTTGNNSTRIATTAFVQSTVAGLTGGSGAVTSVAGRVGAITLSVSDVSGAAPLASPSFSGTPTAPTPAQGTNTTQLATTAFVQTAISTISATGGVTSVAGRTGAITLTTADIGGMNGYLPITGGTLTGPLTVTGSISATGDVIAYVSDERLKTRLGNIENALEKVSRLDGFYYELNDEAVELGLDKRGKEVGVSAQQVKEVLPEVIKVAPINVNYMTVQYERIVPLLIEAIKELKTQNELMKEEINKLKGM